MRQLLGIIMVIKRSTLLFLGGCVTIWPQILPMTEGIINRKGNGDLFCLPREVEEMIIMRVMDKYQYIQALKGLRGLARSNRFFYYDEKVNGLFIKLLARYHTHLLRGVCYVDRVFGASYLLKTPGGKSWIKNSYLTESENFKIISTAYFYDLEKNPHKESIQNYMLEVFPNQVPALIKRRLGSLLTLVYQRELSATHQENLPLLSNFLKKLGADHTQGCIQELEFNNVLKNKDIWKLEELLKEGADPDFSTTLPANLIPLAQAIYLKGSKEIINLLLKFGANLNNRSLRDNHRTKKVWTSSPLLVAIHNNSAERVQWLLEHDADPEMEDGSGLPLVYAIQHMRDTDKNKAIQLLIKHGADVNRADKGEVTPLRMAMEKEDKESISALLKKGAHVNKHTFNFLKLKFPSIAQVATDCFQKQENFLKINS